MNSTFDRGFTLVELLVVLAIGAMLVSLVPFAFSKLQEGSQYRDTVRSIVLELRQARHRAAVAGRKVVFLIDLDKRQFGIQGERQKTIPKLIGVKTVAAEFDRLSDHTKAYIAFMPEGGSTGGSIELIRPSGAGTRIRVDWLFGQVTQEKLLL